MNRICNLIYPNNTQSQIVNVFQNDGGTYAGQSRRSCGGVGRNIADALIKLGMQNTRLISVVGHDEFGKLILESLGTSSKTVKRMSDVNTARYVVVNLCRFRLTNDI